MGGISPGAPAIRTTVPHAGCGYLQEVDRPPTTSSRTVSILRRATDLARRVVRGLSLLAVVAAVCVSLAWLVWLADGPVGGTEGWLERFVALAVALIPSGVLLLFVSGLRELAKIPERARTLPADVRAELAPRPGSDARGRGPIASLLRLARIAWGSRDVLTPYAAVSIALRPAILLAALAATAAALAIVILSVT